MHEVDAYMLSGSGSLSKRSVGGVVAKPILLPSAFLNSYRLHTAIEPEWFMSSCQLPYSRFSCVVIESVSIYVHL